MIRVTVELFPGGNEKLRRTLGTLEIRRAPGRAHMGGIRRYTLRQYSGKRCIRTSATHYSSRYGFWTLIRCALADLL